MEMYIEDRTGQHRIGNTWRLQQNVRQPCPFSMYLNTEYNLSTYAYGAGIAQLV